MARHVARMLGSTHHETVISGEQFVLAWERLVSEGSHPLTTPNEIAITLLSQAIAPHAKAALSGEGADELFGGYGAPLEATLGWIDAPTRATCSASARSWQRAAPSASCSARATWISRPSPSESRCPWPWPSSWPWRSASQCLCDSASSSRSWTASPI
jgi:asparagine synthetase B (glutamine-hydrolysing)